MTYFTYRQNNSHGFFEAPAVYVIVNAENATEADSKAMEAGVYFDTEFEQDCPCCGERWLSAVEGYAEESDEYPQIDISDFVTSQALFSNIMTQIVIE